MALDLPIAIGILAASGQLRVVDASLRTTVLIRELAPGGPRRRVAGVMLLARPGSARTESV